MSRFSAATAALLVARAVQAQSGPYTVSDSTTTRVYTITQDTGGDVPLASKHFQYPNLPYKADSGDGPRGTQQGYNLCNSTTLGQDSFCQTAIFNSVEDFCIWGAPFPNVTVAEDEEQLVAYCTTPNHGTRVLPPGAIQGVQFTKTPGYVQAVGFIDQTMLGLQANDYGGEEDPHGADQRGNPLGALMYSTAFGNEGSSNYTQVIEWSYFVGSGTFCYKACDPAGPNAARLCEHVYDRVGCTYNAPADYASINGTFQSCQGDNQLPVGVYVGENGQTSTWYQPAESLGPITTVPYTPAIPSSSQCSSYTSDSLYTALAAYYSSASPAAATTTAASSVSGASTSRATGSAASAASGRGVAAAASTSASNTGAAGKGAIASFAVIAAGVIGALAVMS